jgi:periplasmic protein TonB
MPWIPAITQRLMHMTIDTNGPSSRDRAGFTLFGSALLHVVVILGIGFSLTLGQPAQRASTAISTTLATSQTSEKVDDAEVFAQSAQQGGGLSDDDQPLRSPIPLTNDPQTRMEQTASSRNDATRTGIEDTFLVVELPSEILLAYSSEVAFSSKETDGAHQEETEAMLLSPLSANLDEELTTGLRVPRQKFISSRTREHKYASYMEAWRAQVEEVGNTNYPEEARVRRLSGNLVLDVAIRSDGSIEEVNVVRSSGQKALDDSAVRIVMMAAPFKPFPEEILKEVDLLHITRTWQFLHNSALIRN